MRKLVWKKKYLNDRSGYWYEAKIKSINWTYVVESNSWSENLYDCYLFVNDSDEAVQISKKKHKTLDSAQNSCQKHVEIIIAELQKEI